MVAAVKYENILMNIYELILRQNRRSDRKGCRDRFWSASGLEEKRGVTGELTLKIEKDMTRPSELAKPLLGRPIILWWGIIIKVKVSSVETTLPSSKTESCYPTWYLKLFWGFRQNKLDIHYRLISQCITVCIVHLVQSSIAAYA